MSQVVGKDLITGMGFIGLEPGRVYRMRKGPKAVTVTVSGNPAILEHSVAGKLKGLKLNGKSVQNSTTGAQLLPLVDNGPVVITGLTWQTKDSVVSAKGTCTVSNAASDYYIVGAAEVYKDAGFPEGTIAVSLQNMPEGLTFFVVKNYRNTLCTMNKAKPFATFTHTSGNTYRIMFRGTKDVSYDAQDIKVMFNTGDSALPWEPYTGGIQSPNPDYPQEITSAGDAGNIPVTISSASKSQNFNIPTPNGLLGIPVDSGGNLTDSSGQQWICDEVDFARKVYTQRCVKLVLNGTEPWALENITSGFRRFCYTTAYKFYFATRRKALFSHFYYLGSGNVKGLGFVFSNQIYLYPVASGVAMTVDEFTAWLKENPVTVVAPLYTPVEILLTDGQVQAFESMCTYDGTTTVEAQEDVSCMEVSYDCDIKTAEKEVNALYAELLAEMEA